MQEEIKKDYYRVADIIMAFRSYYLEAQELLVKMQELTNINSKYARLFIKLKSRENKPRIRLIASRTNQSSMKIMLHMLQNKDDYSFSPIRNDNALFDLDEKGQFTLFNPFDMEYFYNPEVTIDEEDKDLFQKLYEELKKTTLFALPELYRKINPYQSILLSGNEISLDNVSENHEGISIIYTIEDDRIHVISNIGYSTRFIEELMETKIPRYLLPNEYLNILDNEKKEVNSCTIIDPIARKHEELTIEEQDKKLILTRGHNYL